VHGPLVILIPLFVAWAVCFRLELKFLAVDLIANPISGFPQLGGGGEDGKKIF
jgi:hypothetical protein